MPRWAEELRFHHMEVLKWKAPERSPLLIAQVGVPTLIWINTTFGAQHYFWCLTLPSCQRCFGANNAQGGRALASAHCTGGHANTTFGANTALVRNTALVSNTALVPNTALVDAYGWSMRQRRRGGRRRPHDANTT